MNGRFRVDSVIFLLYYFFMANYKFVFGRKDKYVSADQREGYADSLVIQVPPADEYRNNFGRLQGKKRRNARAKASRT